MSAADAQTPPAAPDPAPDPAPDSRPRRRRRWWRVLVIVVAVVVLLGVLLRLALPSLTEAGVAHFGSQALGAPVSVENVDFGLLRGRLLVEGLQIGEDHARWDHVEAELNWRALLDRRIEVEALALHGPRARLLQAPDGSIVLTPEQLARLERAGTVVAEVEERTDEVDATGEPWAFALRRLSIVDQGLDLTDAQGRVVLQVDLDELTLEHLRFDAEGLHLGELLLKAPRIVLRDDLTLGPPSAEEAPEPAGAPLPVSIGHVLLSDGQITLRGDEAELVLTPRVEARDVTLTPGAVIPVDLELGIDGAPLAVTGELGLDPLSFTGSVSLGALGLPAYAAALLDADAPGLAGWWRGGRLDLALELAYTGDAADVSGRVNLGDLSLADPADERRALSWPSLEIVARAVHVPLDGSGPPRVDLERVALAAPRASWVLPPADPPATDAFDTEVGDAADTGADEAAPATDDAAAEPPPPLEFSLDELALTDGDLSLFSDELDYQGGIQEFEFGGRQLRFPELRALDLRLAGLTAAQSPLRLTGSLQDGLGRFELVLDSLPLARFSPLTAQAAGYHLHDGTLTLDTQLDIDGERYATENTLVLTDLSLSADDPGAFSDMFGMPLDLALALLRDPSGTITLSVPVAVDGGEVQAGLGSIVGTALREALVGAITSPLKLLGAAFDMFGGDDGGELDLMPFVCVPGRSALAEDDADERMAALVDLLEARPALALRLRGGTGPEDRDTLALTELVRRALAGTDLPDLDDAGWFGPDRVQEALAERGRQGSPCRYGWPGWPCR